MKLDQRRTPGFTMPGAAPAGPAHEHSVRGADRHVVVLAPARGDSGNRAVLDALLELSRGPVDVVLGAEGEPAPPLLVPAGASVQAAPALLAGSKSDRRAAVGHVEGLLDGAGHCTVIAPDAVAGGDDVRAFARCLALARTAAAAGLDTRVIGLAWSLGGGSAGAAAVEAAARAGVRLFLRDDLSLIRALNEGLPGLHASADLAFAGTDRDPSVLDGIAADGAPLAVLAVCAAVTPDSDPAPDYVATAEHLQQRGAHVVLLPSSPTGYDLLLLGRIARSLRRGGVTVLRRALGSAELRALTSAARVTITDRTRTAVIALSAGSAVLGLTRQRELEDLLRSTGLLAYGVLPRPGFAGAVRPVVDGILDDEATVRRQVRKVLPDLVALADSAVQGLPGTHGLRRVAT